MIPRMNTGIVKRRDKSGPVFDRCLIGSFHVSVFACLPDALTDEVRVATSSSS